MTAPTLEEQLREQAAWHIAPERGADANHVCADKLTRAAAELARLREENEHVLAANREGKLWVDAARLDIARLRAENEVWWKGNQEQLAVQLKLEEDIIRLRAENAAIRERTIHECANVCVNLEFNGKNDPRDSWCGNCADAIRALLAAADQGRAGGEKGGKG